MKKTKVDGQRSIKQRGCELGRQRVLDTKRDVHMSREQLEKWGAAARAQGISRALWIRRACDERADIEEQGGSVVVLHLPHDIRARIEAAADEQYRTVPSMILAILGGRWRRVDG